MKLTKNTLLLLLFTMMLGARSAKLKPVVMIDPGHGGSDCGARTKINKKTVCEKTLTLKIAKALQAELAKLHIDARLTRDKDKTIELEERAKIAEASAADLFVSIHLNSAHSRSGKGFETFYLDNHTDLAVKKIEEIENKSSKVKHDEVIGILNDFIISQTAPASKKLATEIHKNIGHKIKKYKRVDRGIKPALFYVLALNKRPSVLLEAGFMSNAKETKIITSKNFINNYTKGVAKGIKRYFKKTKVKVELEEEELSLF